MDHLTKLRSSLRLYLTGLLLLAAIVSLGLLYGLTAFAHLADSVALAISLVTAVVIAVLSAGPFINFATRPLEMVRQAVLHLSPTEQGTAAPKPETLKAGRELVTALTAQVYQLATVAQTAAAEQQKLAHSLHHEFVAQNLPLPVLVMDATDTITFANEAAAHYIGIAAEDMTGKNIYMVLDMSFPNEDTFDKWLKSVKSRTATAVMSWERVRLNIRDGHPVRMFDLAAYYNRDNPERHETMLVLFDHTKAYSQDDQAVSFIALSVHELRTPLTLLRGYIEVFQEELGQTATPELKSFMLKMQAMSDQLMAFVNTILNVARVEDDQLELRLQKEDWPTVLKAALEMVSLRAKVRGITLKAKIHPGLPPVGVDRISITEVINNLVDNAIKYSGGSKEIRIETYANKEGMVETTIQDFGVGIGASVIPNLFTKFYRDHRNRAQIGGTGLGLYLCKAIINAHDGNIWVRSTESKGSTFGFTLQPFDKLAEAKKGGQDQAITRSAQGWIKNHSLYRR